MGAASGMSVSGVLGFGVFGGFFFLSSFPGTTGGVSVVPGPSCEGEVIL